MRCNKYMKQISLPAGRYVVAVSGGVDSMVLLDVLRQLPGVSLVVAHVDHGIRTDSHKDSELVASVAMSHNLPFERRELALGPGVSEEVARDARYKFLRHIKERYAADAIITAHHADDVTETAIINLIRGTGWRGLSSLRSRQDIVRPLLRVPKAEIVAYAKEHGLLWREDSTNSDLRYLRNVVRLRVLPKASPNMRRNLDEIIVRQNQLTKEIDAEVQAWINSNAVLTKTTTSLPRYEFIMMPPRVAHEVFQAVLRQTIGKSLPRPLVEQALLFVKVAKAGKVMPLGRDVQLRAIRREVIVEPRENVIS